MNLTADIKTQMGIKRLYVTAWFDLDDFDAWCHIKADDEGQSQYFETDFGDEPSLMTTEFLFDKYLEENDLDSLAKEYLTEKLEQ